MLLCYLFSINFYISLSNTIYVSRSIVDDMIELRVSILGIGRYCPRSIIVVDFICPIGHIQQHLCRIGIIHRLNCVCTGNYIVRHIASRLLIGFTVCAD